MVPAGQRQQHQRRQRRASPARAGSGASASPSSRRGRAATATWPTAPRARAASPAATVDGSDKQLYEVTLTGLAPGTAYDAYCAQAGVRSGKLAFVAGVQAGPTISNSQAATAAGSGVYLTLLYALYG